MLDFLQNIGSSTKASVKKRISIIKEIGAFSEYVDASA
jgi:hypothetical protein